MELYGKHENAKYEVLDILLYLLVVVFSLGFIDSKNNIWLFF